MSRFRVASEVDNSEQEWRKPTVRRKKRAESIILFILHYFLGPSPHVRVWSTQPSPNNNPLHNLAFQAPLTVSETGLQIQREV